jgi:Arc/MetJ family transcription regulator
MKLTINLDPALVERAVKATGAKTKPEAITIALREVDRRARLVEILREGLGADADELRAMFDPASDPLAMRVAENPADSPDAPRS